MADMKMAYRMYKEGFNCGQIVATCCAPECGFDEKTGRAALGGFGGGMHRGENCSAVIGAVVSLGLYCNQSEPNDSEAKEKIKAMTKAFTDKFEEKFGSLCCRDLMNGDLNRCGGFIDFSETAVKELVAQDKAK